uniref:Phosphopantetheine adenylyltransferase n=1 Tax=Lygus hesperus TaxID=30085 RepID=A0A0A9Z444_LYGHE
MFANYGTELPSNSSQIFNASWSDAVVQAYGELASVLQNNLPQLQGQNSSNEEICLSLQQWAGLVVDAAQQPDLLIQLIGLLSPTLDIPSQFYYQLANNVSDPNVQALLNELGQFIDVLS